MLPPLINLVHPYFFRLTEKKVAARAAVCSRPVACQTRISITASAKNCKQVYFTFCRINFTLPKNQAFSAHIKQTLLQIKINHLSALCRSVPPSPSPRKAPACALQTAWLPARLAQTHNKNGSTAKVCVAAVWCARRESNPEPTASEAVTLSNCATDTYAILTMLL